MLFRSLTYATPDAGAWSEAEATWTSDGAGALVLEIAATGEVGGMQQVLIDNVRLFAR